MNRSELVAELARSKRLSRRLAERLVKAFFEEISSALARGERVELRGFGVFETHKRRTFLGKHPRTGESILVSPGRTVHFKPSQKLRGRINR